MKNLESYREILVRKAEMKPVYLWSTPFGSFLEKQRNFSGMKVLDFGCDINAPAYRQFKAQNNSGKTTQYNSMS